MILLYKANLCRGWSFPYKLEKSSTTSLKVWKSTYQLPFHLRDGSPANYPSTKWESPPIPSRLREGQLQTPLPLCGRTHSQLPLPLAEVLTYKLPSHEVAESTHNSPPVLREGIEGRVIKALTAFLC